MLRLLFSLLFLPLSLSALYNGNPSFPMMPDDGAFISKEYWIGLKAGYEFDDVYDRHLHMAGKTPDHSQKKAQKYDSLSNFGVVTLNLNDRVEIFGLLGSMSAKLSQNLFEDTKVSYATQTDFAWGAGGRAILAYWGDLQLGLNASYVWSNLSLSSLKVNGRSFAKEHTQFEFREWQVGIGVSYRFRWFIPYLGVDYSDFRTRIEHLNSIKFLFPEKHITFKEAYAMGLFFGFGISPVKAFNVNVEARLINENALTVSADFKF
jgi:hypothetical protein